MGVSKTFHHLNYDATVELGKAYTLPSPEKRFIEILLPANENDDGKYSKINRSSGLFNIKCRWFSQKQVFTNPMRLFENFFLNLRSTEFYKEIAEWPSTWFER